MSANRREFFKAAGLAATGAVAATSPLSAGVESEPQAQLAPETVGAKLRELLETDTTSITESDSSDYCPCPPVHTAHLSRAGRVIGTRPAPRASMKNRTTGEHTGRLNTMYKGVKRWIMPVVSEQ